MSASAPKLTKVERLARSIVTKRGLPIREASLPYLASEIVTAINKAVRAERRACLRAVREEASVTGAAAAIRARSRVQS